MGTIVIRVLMVVIILLVIANVVFCFYYMYDSYKGVMDSLLPGVFMVLVVFSSRFIPKNRKDWFND